MNASQISHRANIFHPGVQHSQEFAFALQQAKILNYYITTLGRANFTKARFSLSELDPSLVVRYPWPELFRFAFSQAYFPGYLKKQAAFFAGRVMDLYVSKHFVKDIDAIIGFSGSTLESFKEAKKKKIRRVLDQPALFTINARQILKNEAELNPDFAATIDEGLEDPAWQESRAEEARLADLIVCGSYLVKQSLEKEKIDSAKIRVVTYGVNAEAFACRRDGESFFKDNVIRILFVGTIGQRKGIKYLLEAIKKIGNKKIELTLVGNFYGPRAPYKPYAGWFRHVPQVPFSMMKSYYEKADLLVLPSVAEGFGLPVLEAMASGIPVIVSENTGAKDVVEDGKEGFIIPVGNVEPLKEKILYFYESPVKVLEMGENARKKAQHFSWLYYQGNIKAAFDQFLRGTN